MAFGANGGAEETRKMKWVLGTGLVALSFGIGSFNTWGAWVRSQHFSWTTVVVGAEVMMFVALGLGVVAQTPVRKAACFIITAALAWFCVQNGKFAVKEMFAEIYQTEAGERLDPQTLIRQAEILEGQIPNLEQAAQNAETTRGDELNRVRRAIAVLETERELMLVEVGDPTQFNRQVLRAQQSLQARGEYAGNLDGIYGELTRQGMLSRGSDVSRELTILKRQEAALNPSAAIGAEEVNINDIGTVGVALTAGQKAEAGAAKLRENAAEIIALNRWGERALWVVEIARSFSVWAFLMTVTAASTKRTEETEEDDKPEKPEAANDAQSKPKMTQAELNAQKGGEANAHKRKTAKAQKIIIPGRLEIDGEAA